MDDMLAKVSPEAAERLVKGLESLAAAHSAPGSAAAAGPGSGAASVRTELSLEYVSVSLSVTEVSGSVSSTQGKDGSVVEGEVHGRRVELRVERVRLRLGQELQETDPMVLDIDGDGFDLRQTSDGVMFDLRGGQDDVLTAFVQDDDALLFLDDNGNGLLDDGSELVGNRVDGLNGFEELAALDDNGDDIIDARDEAWGTLRLFQDRDGNGSVSEGEVALLEDLGISELSTLWQRDEVDDGEGLSRLGNGGFVRADRTAGAMRDYMFGFRNA